jgi:hypothetical protein
MTNPTKMTLLSVALAAFLLPVAAQDAATPQSPTSTPTTQTAPTPTPQSPSATPTSPSPTTTPSPSAAHKDRTVTQRANREQNRIANGEASGELNANEANKLEKQDATINQDERNMRKADDGHLTAADRASLRQQQNKVSQQIYQDKTNAKTQNTDPQSKLGKREQNQQQRIAQGTKSGQLTAGETGKLEGEQAGLNHEIAKDKNANGGHLTAAERAQVNRQQNHMSKQIYKDKHNAGKRAR